MNPWKRMEQIGDVSKVTFAGFDGAMFVSIYAIEKDGKTMTSHPCPKPLPLFNQLLTTVGRLAEFTCDPFMGSERIDNAYRQKRMFP
jgi:hypothetical protein